MSILLSGDIHGRNDLDKLSEESVRTLSPLEKINYLIVLGDWSVIWNDAPLWLKEEADLLAQYSGMRWETLVVLGNHEGYSRISELPWAERHGAPVQQVTDKVFILQNGYIYTIEGKSFLVFGGAMSVDRDKRVPGIDWWSQEIPSMGDLARAIASLERNQNKVDYVLTHTCPTEMAQYLARLDRIFAPRLGDPTCKMLSVLHEALVSFRGW